MKLKGYVSPPLRVVDGYSIVVDKRKFYKFVTPDGRLAETKANTLEEAKDYIENCLQVELKEAA